MAMPPRENFYFAGFNFHGLLMNYETTKLGPLKNFPVCSIIHADNCYFARANTCLTLHCNSIDEANTVIHWTNRHKPISIRFVPPYIKWVGSFYYNIQPRTLGSFFVEQNLGWAYTLVWPLDP